jgi:hypothetical protein
VEMGRGAPERMARRLRREEGEGTREMSVGWEEGGEELKAESSVRRRFVGVRDEAEDVEDVDERGFGADIILR